MRGRLDPPSCLAARCSDVARAAFGPPLRGGRLTSPRPNGCPANQAFRSRTSALRPVAVQSPRPASACVPTVGSRARAVRPVAVPPASESIPRPAPDGVAVQLLRDDRKWRRLVRWALPRLTLRRRGKRLRSSSAPLRSCAPPDRPFLDRCFQAGWTIDPPSREAPGEHPGFWRSRTISPSPGPRSVVASRHQVAVVADVKQARPTGNFSERIDDRLMSRRLCLDGVTQAAHPSTLTKANSPKRQCLCGRSPGSPCDLCAGRARARRQPRRAHPPRRGSAGIADATHTR
jgi:hypothetical protein